MTINEKRVIIERLSILSSTVEEFFIDLEKEFSKEFTVEKRDLSNRYSIEIHVPEGNIFMNKIKIEYELKRGILVETEGSIELKTFKSILEILEEKIYSLNTMEGK